MVHDGRCSKKKNIRHRNSQIVSEAFQPRLWLNFSFRLRQLPETFCWRRRQLELPEEISFNFDKNGAVRIRTSHRDSNLNCRISWTIERTFERQVYYLVTNSIFDEYSMTYVPDKWFLTTTFNLSFVKYPEMKTVVINLATRRLLKTEWFRCNGWPGYVLRS